jgi:sec-independent protein translocase protein TatC
VKSKAGPPDDRKLPFMQHLIELRSRFRNSAIAYVVALVVCLVLFGQEIETLLARPLAIVWQAEGFAGPMTLNYASPIDPLWIQVKLSAIAAFFVASPVIFYQAWRFIAPGLYGREKRVILAVVATSVLFFAGGALFGYLVIFPASFRFMLSFTSGAMDHMTKAFGFVSYNLGPAWKLQPTLMIDEYTSLVVRMLLLFGAVFELPLVVVVLAYLGIVTPRALIKFEKWAFLLAFIFGAIVAPDPLTQAFVGLPLFALYNLAILGAWLFRRRRREAPAST